MTQADLDKFANHKINCSNILFLSADDLKRVGLEVGPAK